MSESCTSTPAAANHERVLQVQELRKEFATRGEPLLVLRGVSLELAAGEAMAIMGPSGSGKSTLLHILGTLERPTAGRVRFAGRDPFALPERELAAFRNRHVGFVFQDHHLLPQCSALENVLIPSLVGPRDDAVQRRALGLLDRVGLADRVDHRPAELSGGERQRVAIARAFINRPVLLLADEPTGNLDRTTAHVVADLFCDLQRIEGASLIVVTHSAELASRFPRRAELVDGRLVFGVGTG
jgi:lipoprotein-releasing system ATP-binding protein